MSRRNTRATGRTDIPLGSLGAALGVVIPLPTLRARSRTPLGPISSASDEGEASEEGNEEAGDEGVAGPRRGAGARALSPSDEIDDEVDD